MEFPWKRKLPTGETLYKDAERLGLHFDKSDKTRDADLQQRVLVTWAERRNAIVNYTQTVAIVVTLLITLGVAFATQREQRNRESADLMLETLDSQFLNDAFAGGEVVLMENFPPYAIRAEYSAPAADPALHSGVTMGRPG